MEKRKRNAVHSQIIFLLCVPIHICTMLSLHLVFLVVLGKGGNPDMSPCFLSLPLDYNFNILHCLHCLVDGFSIFPKCQHQSAILTFLYCLNRSHLHVGSGYSLYHSLLGNSSSQICCLALGSVGDHLTNWWGTVHASLL